MNNEQLKTKLRWLIVGFVAFLVIAYKLSVYDTLDLIKAVADNDREIARYEGMAMELSASPVAKLNISSFELNDTLQPRQMLSRFISSYARENGCIVKDIPEMFAFENNNFKVETNRFSVSGYYLDLIRLLDRLESQSNNLTRVVSVRWHIETERLTKRAELVLDLVTQSIERRVGK